MKSMQEQFYDQFFEKIAHDMDKLQKEGHELVGWDYSTTPSHIQGTIYSRPPQST